MKSEQYIKIKIPMEIKEKLVCFAHARSMHVSACVRFFLYDAIKEDRIMTSVPTMKSDAFLKFKAPVEMYMHIKKQAELSNIPISGYIRVLLYETFNNSGLST